MALQTTVSLDLALSLPGVARGEPRAVHARLAEVAIYAGLFVCQGTLDGQCKLPTSAAEVAKGLGIAEFLPTLDSRFPSGGSAGVTYQIGDPVDAIVGQVYVTVEEAVSAMDPVYVRWADGNGGRVQKGAFRKSADQVAAADTATQLTGARYLTGASAGSLALVEINLPQ